MENNFVVMEQQVFADFDGVSIPKLPPELWKLILDNIKDSPTTLVSCYNTCKSWRDLLEEKKSEFYFPLILPCLEKYLSNNELLACRQVCSSWMGSMDEHLQSEEHPWDRYRFFGRGFRGYGDDPILHSRKRLGCNHFLEDAEDPDGDPRAFLETMSNHPGNPFPTRCVVVGLWSPEAYSRFLRVLQMFGKEIRTLVFVGSVFLEPTSASHIQPILNHCTNLTSMSLMMPDSWELPAVRNTLRWMHATPSQLPDIPSLAYLKIWGAGSGSVANVFLEKYGNQLRRLEVNQEVITDRHRFATSSTENFINRGHRLTNLLPNLTTLRVRNQGRLCDALETLRHCYFGRLERLFFWEYSLDPRRGPKVCFRVLIRAINTFSTSLVQLFMPIDKDKLKMPLPAVFRDPERRQSLEQELAVQFPKLSTLGVSSTIMNSESLEMLVRKFVALEELIFSDDWCFKVLRSMLVKKGEVHCKTQWRQMLEKLEGFWELVPRLKRISVIHAMHPRTKLFLLHRPQSPKDMEEQREAAVVALWEAWALPLLAEPI